MNNPDDFQFGPEQIEEQRDWLNAHKAQTGLSYGKLAALIGIPSGTLSTFATNNYGGRNDNIAKAVFKYRQLLDDQAERTVGLIEAPSYFETETSRRLRALLALAHAGRITVGATGPGTGKTVTMTEYAASVPNVWVATMDPTTATTNAMMVEVLGALGVTAKAGWGAAMSKLIMDAVRGRRGLLVIDEAGHLDTNSLETIRAWHDRTGVGVCLFGNEELLARIEGGPRRDAFGRLNSRIAARHIQNLPTDGDVAAFCDAYGFDDAGVRQMLARVALTPGAGGLRECRQIVEQASLLASEDNRPLTLSDLRDAQSTRATRNIRA